MRNLQLKDMLSNNSFTDGAQVPLMRGVIIWTTESCEGTRAAPCTGWTLAPLPALTHAGPTQHGEREGEPGPKPPRSQNTGTLHGEGTVGCQGEGSGCLEWCSLAFAVCKYQMFLLPVAITGKFTEARGHFDLVLKQKKPNPQQNPTHKPSSNRRHLDYLSSESC